VISRLIGRDGAVIHVRERGAGPAVMFGHSLGFDGDMWRAQVAALAPRYRTLAIDFRGHGRSVTEAPFDLDDLADDVAAVLDTLAIARVTYCGLSLGGMVGMRFALRYPERVAALALLNTSAEAEPPARRQVFEAYNERARGHADLEGAALMMTLMFSREFLIAQPQVTAPYREKLMRQDGGDGRYHAARAVLARSHILGELAAIQVPTLVIGSTGDTAVPAVHAQAIAEAIPNATLRILDGGHMSAVEQAGEGTKALVELLG